MERGHRLAPQRSTDRESLRAIAAQNAHSRRDVWQRCADLSLLHAPPRAEPEHEPRGRMDRPFRALSARPHRGQCFLHASHGHDQNDVRHDVYGLRKHRPGTYHGRGGQRGCRPLPVARREGQRVLARCTRYAPRRRRWRVQLPLQLPHPQHALLLRQLRHQPARRPPAGPQIAFGPDPRL